MREISFFNIGKFSLYIRKTIIHTDTQNLIMLNLKSLETLDHVGLISQKQSKINHKLLADNSPLLMTYCLTAQYLHSHFLWSAIKRPILKINQLFSVDIRPWSQESCDASVSQETANPEFNTGHEGLSGFLRSRLLTSQSSWLVPMSLAVICSAQIKHSCPKFFLRLNTQLIALHKKKPVSALCKQTAVHPDVISCTSFGT